MEMRPVRTADRGSRSGQTLLISVIILFLLLFLGAVFMVMISHNLTRTGRSRDVLQATKLAEAGLRYANQMLLYSEDGADWRPPLTDTDTVLANDPDREWIKDMNPADGVLPFTRYLTEDGRFLLRVTYEPMNLVIDDTKPADMSQADWERIVRDIRGLRLFLKIEAIGRPGYISPNDPTTFPEKPDRLRRELVAYKPIGLVENLWFITNKSGLNEPLRMGVPTLGMGGSFAALGSRMSYLNGSIRVNGDLEWTGGVRIKLDPLGIGEPAGPYDRVAVAGLIRHSSPADVALYYNGVYQAVQPSLDPSFSDWDGRYLDAAAPLSGRKVTRIDPPLVDQVGIGGSAARYRMMTRDSGQLGTWPDAVPWLGFAAGQTYNTGWFGLGRGIYINNTGDRQAKDVASQWATPGSDGWYGWQYRPPGVEIVVYPYDLGRSRWPIESRSWGISQDPNDSSNRFYNDPGTPDVWIRRSDGGYFVVPNPATGQPITLTEIVLDYPDNGVIFAEGNVRVRGTVGSPSSQAAWWQGIPDVPRPRKGFPLTVVSDHTIYIEGNVLKERRWLGGDWVRYDDTGVALLARENVCLNTTRFTRVDTGFQLSHEAVAKPYLPYDVQMSGWQPGHDFFRVSFDFGTYASENAQQALEQMPLYLLVEHAAAAVPFSAYALSLTVPYSNFYSHYLEWPEAGWADWFGFNVLWDVATQIYPSFEMTAFRLWSTGQGNFSFTAVPGVEYNMYVTPPIFSAQVLDRDWMLQASDYYVERYAVEPIDVWVEAALYAEEGCFFIIPGYWLNTNEDDLPDPTQGKVGSPRPVTVTDPIYPFYYEPIDARITIYGSVTECTPAESGHAMDWIEKWGWTPDTLGSSDLPAKWAEPNADRQSIANEVSEFNVRYIYDPAFRYWGLDTNGNPAPFAPGVVGQRVRRTADGQVLPLLPKLPVSPTMIYAGESMQVMRGP
jgi:hypothetical protein